MREFDYPSETIEAAYEEAAQILEVRAPVLYRAFSLLPRERFYAVSALYAFSRYADDIVDEYLLGESKERVSATLDALQNRIATLYPSSESPVSGERITREQVNVELDEQYLRWWPAFVDTISRFPTSSEVFLRQIEAQRLDLEAKDIQNLNALFFYARLLAATIGSMVMALLEERPDGQHAIELQFASENLGMAMCFTNILRDVGEDILEEDQVYLPISLLKEEGVSRVDILHLAQTPKGEKPEVPQGFVKVWELIFNLGETFYRDFEKYLGELDPYCRLPLLYASRLYRQQAVAVRESGYNCFNQEIVLSDNVAYDLLRECQIDLKEKAL